MKTLKQQRGISFFALMFLLAMVGAIGLFGLKVFPLYMDYSSVSKAFDDLPGVAGLGKQGKSGIIKRLNGQLYIDAVKTYDARETNIVKSKKNKTWIVTADYEAKANLVENIFVVIHFEKSVEIPR